LFQTFKTIVFVTVTLTVLAGLAACSQSGTHQTARAADPVKAINSQQTPTTSETLPATGSDLFNDPPPIDGGWKGLAKALQALTPSVDTRIPLTPSQITDRIAHMITQGQYDDALRIIEQRKAQRQEQNLMGADVQLMFLEGRALAASGQLEKAIAVYRDMTIQYPELPEPWNNLSAAYTKQNRLDMAENALHTALTINPDYAAARLNLGIVQLISARDSFNQAASLGVSEAGDLAARITQLLQP